MGIDMTLTTKLVTPFPPQTEGYSPGDTAQPAMNLFITNVSYLAGGGDIIDWNGNRFPFYCGIVVQACPNGICFRSASVYRHAVWRKGEINANTYSLERDNILTRMKTDSAKWQHLDRKRI